MKRFELFTTSLNKHDPFISWEKVFELFTTSLNVVWTSHNFINIGEMYIAWVLNCSLLCWNKYDLFHKLVKGVWTVHSFLRFCFISSTFVIFTETLLLLYQTSSFAEGNFGAFIFVLFRLEGFGFVSGQEGLMENVLYIAHLYFGSGEYGILFSAVID